MNNLQLSKDFWLREFVVSQTAVRLGIDNTPPDEVISNLKNLCILILQPLRDQIGPIRISSGYRCLELNRHVGSKDNSQHVTGEAADIQLISGNNSRIIQRVFLSFLPFDQMINEYNLSWVHISYSLRNRRQFFKI